MRGHPKLHAQERHILARRCCSLDKFPFLFFRCGVLDSDQGCLFLPHQSSSLAANFRARLPNLRHKHDIDCRSDKTAVVCPKPGRGCIADIVFPDCRTSHSGSAHLPASQHPATHRPLSLSKTHLHEIASVMHVGFPETGKCAVVVSALPRWPGKAGRPVEVEHGLLEGHKATAEKMMSPTVRARARARSQDPPVSIRLAAGRRAPPFAKASTRPRQGKMTMSATEVSRQALFARWLFPSSEHVQ